MPVRPVALLLAALAAAPAASAQPQVAAGPVSARLADLRLATAVRLALVDDVRTRGLDLDVAARNGAVEVEGEIPARDRRTVDEVARAVPGVRSLGGVGTLVERAAGPTVEVEMRAPAAAPAPRPEGAGPTYHRVRSGDTLFSLARRYETTVEALRALNDLRGSGIRVGQRLRVR